MAGKLRVFLGAAPGVGKTYAMLAEGRRLRDGGLDVVVAFVETYGRRGTEAQLDGLPRLPRRTIGYRGMALTELDVDAVLARRPALALVDELAHTNVPGSRNTKRWQDVHELLAAGIDVATTLNIQHLESLNDVVEQITGAAQREQIPDAVVRAADRIELVDLSPEALRRRIAEGDVYPPDRVDPALDNYFRPGNLGALRELALLWLADRVEEELANYRARHGIRSPWETKERILVALNGAPQGEHLIRRGARTAARVHGDLLAIHVRPDDGSVYHEPPTLEAQRQLLRELDGSYTEIAGSDVARALVDFAHTESATQILLGPTGRSRLHELAFGSVINRVIRLAGPIDVRVLPPPSPGMLDLPPSPARRRPAPVAPRRRWAAWLLGPAGAVAVAWLLSPARASLGLSGALLCLLLGVAGVARLGGLAPAAGTTAAAALAADFFLTEPRHSLTITRAADAAALLVFLAVAGIISHLIDWLNRRSQEAARARAEAQALARLAGETVRAASRSPRRLLAELRRTFRLDAAAILAPTGVGWRAVATSGQPVPERPEDAPFAAELDRGAVLVLVGPALTDENMRLLGPFVTQLRLAEERERLIGEAAGARALARTNELHAAQLSALADDLSTVDPALSASLRELGRLRSGRLHVHRRTVPLGELLPVGGGLPSVEADRALLERALLSLNAGPDRIEVTEVADRVELRLTGAGPEPACAVPIARELLESMGGRLTTEENALVVSLRKG